MNDVLGFLKKNKINNCFNELGLDFPKLFPEKYREQFQIAYGDYLWIVKTIIVVGTIINAVPLDDKIDLLPWEEWFLLDGTPTHHVLYLSEPDNYDEIFEAPDQDDIHPPSTLGRKWFVINDTDMSPVLLRGV